jgi:hypothetical protein
MSRSHLGVKYLLAQIESNRSQRTNRDVRPDWLNNLVEEAAASFEPLVGVARVGYECQLEETGWAVSLYLGAVEMVGGRSDGSTLRPDFRCDLKRLLEQFARIDELDWTVWPQGAEAVAELGQQSVVTVRGLVGTSAVCLRVRSCAPHEIGPGLRQFPDGRIESV